MKYLFENWRRYLNEQAEARPLGPAENLGPFLYRISRRYGRDGSDNYKKFKNGQDVIKSSTRASDATEDYASDGGSENRIYFFENESDVNIVIMSGIEDLDAIVGDIEAEGISKDTNESILVIKIPTSDIPDDVEFFTDPELEGTQFSAVYGSLDKPWSITPKPENVMTASEIIGRLEDEEEDYEDDLPMPDMDSIMKRFKGSKF